ncbi:hypothetical protein PM076_08135 [Halorubrum ezzemoulense]|jgi:hypothetical protein|uniref:Uncharacterized protein n=1 Tax=Halorubrum ezzemoulense TaxID=337243 RepID=A0A256JBR1_HALEZ|nr:hypothetical protein [Halorubrum ezzemoulense]MDB2223312.1 hypothetical protein [Halorubrum ezzemoulense]MDB2240680.1 hypothetical protein [Halorubrum ezzemoulense]MDB2243443.1 hypothetical protein [Halorubrum ezzemoulense]MDB2251509.1 hypothetical protein [Halorubrum ezzemoulense]MDB2261068.1 hypothetical protein [Halorubrum ezzemoulense]
MSRTGAWSLPTAAGRVAVAPGEIRVRNRPDRMCVEGLRALANGRAPSVGRDVSGSAVAAAIAALGTLLEWVGSGGTGGGIAAFGLVTGFAGVCVSAVRNARTEIPLRDVRRAEFRDGDVVVVHEDEDGDAVETAFRPRSPAARNDAALALRLRGVDLRGADDADGVSRTVVDAPETELVA